MIIDMHVHIFPDALASRARTQLEKTAGAAACTDITEADTRRRLQEWNIDLGVVMPIATKPTQQRTINDWAATLQHGRLISFGTVHPEAADAVDELARIRSLGLHGIKLHPDYQHFEVDDRRVYPVYEQARALSLPILFHAGFDPVSPQHVHCRPEALRRVVDDFPGLTVIAAHLGGNMMPDEAVRHLAGQDLYLDISMAPIWATFEQFRRIVESHDPERIVFASDCPWSSPAAEMDWVERLPVSTGLKERIYWQNAQQLLGLQELNDGMKSGDAQPAS